MPIGSPSVSMNVQTFTLEFQYDGWDAGIVTIEKRFPTSQQDFEDACQAIVDLVDGAGAQLVTMTGAYVRYGAGAPVTPTP